MPREPASVCGNWAADKDWPEHGELNKTADDGVETAAGWPAYSHPTEKQSFKKPVEDSR